MDNEKIKKGIQIFGITLGVVCLALWIWSLTRPPVTEGPELPPPAQSAH